jgi:hypothetical protein
MCHLKICRNNKTKSIFLIRDSALRAFAEETGSLSFERDFVTTSTTNPSAREAGDFTIRLTEIQYAIVPSESFHSRTLGVIVLRFLPKVS